MWDGLGAHEVLPSPAGRKTRRPLGLFLEDAMTETRKQELAIILRDSCARIKKSADAGHQAHHASSVAKEMMLLCDLFHELHGIPKLEPLPKPTPPHPHH